jgi:hypothetical protein
MSFRKFFLAVIFLSSFGTINAQNASQEFTDEDLKKYATTMDSVDAMKQNLSNMVAEMVRTNTVMPVQRYNELFKIAADEAKLTEAKATPEEIAFLKQVEAKRADEIAKMNATYQSLAKDYVGLKQFNAIKKSIETDEAVKAKYEGMRTKAPGDKG